MNRRARLSKTAPPPAEIEEPVQQELSPLERIKAPVVWARLPCGLRVEDLQEKRFEAALGIIRDYYLCNDVLCAGAEILKDEESVNDFIKRMHFHLKNKTSIVAVDETNEEVIGVLIVRVIQKSTFARVFSRVQLVEGVAHKKIVDIKAALNRKADIFEKYQCDSFLRIYLVAIVPKWRQKGVGVAMVRATLDVARSLKVPVIIGLFSNGHLQKIARKLGFEVVDQINYVDWLENGEMVFDDPGAGNYGLVLMAFEVPETK